MSFNYYTPTKLFIGNEEKNISEIISLYGYKHVLFVYGKNSIKKSGLYDTITCSLNKNNILFYEVSGVSPNPKLELVVHTLKNKPKVDMILAVGGGSVIDTAKLLAVSYFYDGDPWDFISQKVVPQKALPIGVILTISAAGSEMSNSCVITNSELKIKKGFNNDLVRPQFAIMNPKLTYTVSKYQTACGIVDIMLHTLERFITKEESSLADEFGLSILKTVYRYGLKAYNDPTDYEARKAIMLASSFSHNGLTSIGRPFCFRAHLIEHVLSGVHDNIAHGAGLAVVWIAYSKFIYKHILDKYLRLAYEVFAIEPSGDEEKDAYLGIVKLSSFFNALNMPQTLSDLNIDHKEVNELIDLCTLNDTRVVNDVIPLRRTEFNEIFRLMEEI